MIKKYLTKIHNWKLKENIFNKAIPQFALKNEVKIFLPEISENLYLPCPGPAINKLYL